MSRDLRESSGMEEHLGTGKSKSYTHPKPEGMGEEAVTRILQKL